MRNTEEGEKRYNTEINEWLNEGIARNSSLFLVMPVWVGYPSVIFTVQSKLTSSAYERITEMKGKTGYKTRTTYSQHKLGKKKKKSFGENRSSPSQPDRNS